MKRILLVLLILALGCERAQLESLENSAYSMGASADKELYHSGETITLNAFVESPFDINATLRFYGIYVNRYRLDLTKTVSLNKGENNISFQYKAPNCYGCAGISPGTYEIKADLSYNGEVLAADSLDIEIRQ